MALTGLVFLGELSLAVSGNAARLFSLFQAWGFTPSRAGSGWGALTAVTSLYLNGGLGQLFFNLFFLAIFGARVEDLTGPVRFALFYHVAGLLGAAGVMVLERGATAPTVGAGGAVAGVLGAFLILYRGRRVRTLVGVFWPRLPASLLVIAWAFQLAAVGQFPLVNGLTYTGLSIGAFLGGFLGGLVLIRLFLQPGVFHNPLPAP